MHLLPYLTIFTLTYLYYLPTCLIYFYLFVYPFLPTSPLSYNAYLNLPLFRNLFTCLPAFFTYLSVYEYLTLPLPLNSYLNLPFSIYLLIAYLPSTCLYACLSSFSIVFSTHLPNLSYLPLPIPTYFTYLLAFCLSV